MSSPDLSIKIAYILAQSDAARMYLPQGGPVPIPGRAAMRPSIRGDLRVVERPGGYEMVNEQVLLLKKLYAVGSPEDQRRFTSIVFAGLTATNAAVVAHVLLELRDALAFRYGEQIGEPYVKLWAAVVEKLAVEHWTFTDEDLENLTAGAHRLRIVASATIRPGPVRPHGRGPAVGTGRPMLAVLDDFAAVLSRVRYVRLAGELANFGNPSIDADRRVLLSRLEALGFATTLTTALHEIERRGNAATTPLDFKATMDLLRAFFESFIREAATTTANRVGMSLPLSGPFAPWKDVLKNGGILTPREEELMQKLYNYLSVEGTHQLGTGSEQLRVSRITVVEWCMLIAGRVQQPKQS